MSKKSPAAEPKTSPYAQSDWLAPTSDTWTSQRAFFVYESGGGQVGLIPVSRVPGALTSGTALEHLAPTDVFRLRGGHRGDRDGLRAVESAAAAALAKQGLEPTALIEVVAKPTKLKPKFVEGCLRILIARGEILASSDPKRIRLTLSASAREQEQRRLYASSFAHELQIQAERVGMLIGHRPTVGGHREELLRALLQNHIPERFHAATGFISGIPNQFDILIYDRLEYAPHFRAGDLVVVPQSAVRAVIEVKSQLSGAELKKALGHLDAATALDRSGPPIFKGVFAYEGVKPATLASSLNTFYANDYDWDPDVDQPPPVLSDLSDPVSAICVLAKSFQTPRFVPKKAGSPELKPVLLQFASLTGKSSEAALFFDMLMRFLRYPFDGKRPDHGLSGLLVQDMITVAAHPIVNGAWGPYLTDGSHEIDFERRYEAYESWLAGDAWIDRGTAEVEMDSD